MVKPETPDSIVEHQPKFNPDAWRAYSVDELGHWVHLLVKRAGHRAERVKAEKDLADAQNYLNMLQAHLDAAKEEAAVKE